MKAIKALTLMAQLILSFNGEAHIHEAFHYEMRRSAAAISR